MDDLRQRHGDHTWDMIKEYYQCPQCGYIIEDRKQYTFESNKYQKTIVCDRCKHPFIVTRASIRKPSLIE